MLRLLFFVLLTEAFVVPGTPPSTSSARRSLVVRRRELGDGGGGSDLPPPPPPLPNTNDPFVILGIDRFAAGDQASIKSAYHRQAKAYHPDTSITESTPEATRRRINDDFRAINAAYEELRLRFGFAGESAEGGQWSHQQPPGAWYKTTVSEDVPGSYSQPMRNYEKFSPGFVGFMSDAEHQARTPYHTARSHTTAEPARQNRSSSVPPHTTRTDDTVRSVDLAAIKQRCTFLEERLKRADSLVDSTTREKVAIGEMLKRAEYSYRTAMEEKEALEERVKQAENYAQEAKQEVERVNALLEAMAVKHSHEKKQLGAKIAMLKARRPDKPWYH